MKKCSKCGMWKLESEFHKDRSMKDGLKYWCKTCRCKGRTTPYNYQNIKVTCENCGKEYKTIKSKLERNEHNFCSKNCYLELHRSMEIIKCDQCGKLIQRIGTHIEKNKNNFCCNECQSKFRTLNPEIRLEHKRKSKSEWKQRHKNDINIKIAGALRTRLRSALKRKSKSGHTLELLGCTIPELKKHLESLFLEGMTWSNYGKVWHIDHIIPISYPGESLVDPEWQRILCSYKNLQPMFAKENMSKNNKIKFVSNTKRNLQKLV